jgi:hypothetical protein
MQQNHSQDEELCNTYTACKGPDLEETLFVNDKKKPLPNSRIIIGIGPTLPFFNRHAIIRLILLFFNIKVCHTIKNLKGKKLIRHSHYITKYKLCILILIALNKVVTF